MRFLRATRLKTLRKKVNLFNLATRKVSDDSDVIADLKKAGLVPIQTNFEKDMDKDSAMKFLSQQIEKNGSAIITISGHYLVADKIDIKNKTAIIRKPFVSRAGTISLEELKSKILIDRPITQIEKVL